MAYNRRVFRVHAIQRMFERRITEDDVSHVLETGEVIESYEKDTPYPSRLLLGFCGSRPLHVVVADNQENRKTIVITVINRTPRNGIRASEGGSHYEMCHLQAG